MIGRPDLRTLDMINDEAERVSDQRKMLLCALTSYASKISREGIEE